MLSKDKALKKCNNDLLEEANNTNSSPDLECNICLDLVQDPVVTFCGHLYCWPCIYKWIVRFRDTSHEDQNPQCPVCKKDVSEDSLIPLYGRGQTNTTTSCSSGLIPQRPTSPICRNDSFLDYTRDYYPSRVRSHTQQQQQQQSRAYDRIMGNSYMSSSYPVFGIGDSTRQYRLFDPMIGMLGEMVFARMFAGNLDRPLYTYPNSYQLADSACPRQRRRIVEADRSLDRVWFFLSCCVFMCLILF